MHLDSLIATYGYFIIFVGAIFEGETVVALGGLATHEGYLILPLVFTVAFLGAVCGDLSIFLIGRLRGQRIVDKNVWVKRMMVRPQRLIEKHSVLIAFGMRFMYGLRHIMPFTLGMSSLPLKRFIVWNMLSSLIWAGAVSSIGYLFGNLLETFLGRLRHYEFRIILFTILFLGLGYCIHKGIRFILYRINREP